MLNVREELRETGHAIAAVFRDRNLRLMEIARACALLATTGSTILFVVVTYRLGGPSAVAVLALVRLIVTTVAAPFGSLLGDRYDRPKVIVAADSARILNLLGAAAATAWTSSLSLVLGLAALTTAIGMVSSPARAALLPSLAESSDRLAAANVVANATDGVSSLAGPAGAGLALAVTTPAGAFVATAIVAALSPPVVHMLHVPEERRPGESAHRAGLTREAFAGFRAVLAPPSARALVFVYTVVSFVGGALTVLFTVTAIRLLDLGSSGVGFLYTFFSVGAIAGTVISAFLIRRRLDTAVIVGALAWGLPLAAVGVWPNAALACAFFVVGGAGDTVAGVASVTLLQRVIPNDVLSRSFGALGFILTGIGVVGSLVAPLVVDAVGVRGALIAFGALVPLGAIPAGMRLRTAVAEAPGALDVFRDIALFAQIPEPALEQLAASADELRVPPNGTVFREGDEGDRFFVIASGAVEISSDGRVLAVESAGGSFGEISLLRDIPRTATATSSSGADLYAIPRAAFVEALTTHPPALEAVEAVVAGRLAGTA